MRKTLGILNIVAGASILGLLIWFSATGHVSVEFQDLKSIIYLTLFLLVAGTSLACGILILRGKGWILAAVSLIFAGIALFLLFPGVLFALFGD
ncbi:MAG: hypothetical protein A2Z28_04565 [Chloroflexi bacterium RBG_16_51_9]|nr:MAG: hypothetical protein A2Z28_04565 [Chloroflexi bacterium RBG_16_51_9]